MLVTRVININIAREKPSFNPDGKLKDILELLRKSADVARDFLFAIVSWRTVRI